MSQPVAGRWRRRWANSQRPRVGREEAQSQRSPRNEYRKAGRPRLVAPASSIIRGLGRGSKEPKKGEKLIDEGEEAFSYSSIRKNSEKARRGKSEKKKAGKEISTDGNREITAANPINKEWAPLRAKRERTSERRIKGDVSRRGGSQEEWNSA